MCGWRKCLRMWCVNTCDGYYIVYSICTVISGCQDMSIFFHVCFDCLVIMSLKSLSHLKSTQYQEVSGLAQHWGRRLGWSGPWQQKRWENGGCNKQQTEQTEQTPRPIRLCLGLSWLISTYSAKHKVRPLQSRHPLCKWPPTRAKYHWKHHKTI